MVGGRGLRCLRGRRREAPAPHALTLALGALGLALGASTAEEASGVFVLLVEAHGRRAIPVFSGDQKRAAAEDKEGQEETADVPSPWVSTYNLATAASSRNVRASKFLMSLCVFLLLVALH